MICWMYRLLRSVGNESAHGPSGRWQRHLQKCPACRREAGAVENVAQALRLAPHPHAPPANPFLHQRIMRAVQQAGSAEGAGRNHLRLGRLAASTLAVALLAALLAVLQHGRPGPRQPAPQPPPAWGTLLPSAGALARWGMQLDDPLKTEGQLVLQDARNAVAGLAQALPGDLIVSYWPSTR